MDFETRRLESWEKIIPKFSYDPEVPYFDLLVPTIDTVRYGFLMEKLLDIRYSVLFTGTTGVGKVSISFLCLFVCLYDLYPFFSVCDC